MVVEQFNDWLKLLVHIWEDKKPQEVIELVAENFTWYETPFKKPINTKEELIKEWKNVLNQKDLNLEITSLGVIDNTGYARWKATFTLINTENKLRYEGIYQVLLNNKGKCTEFREWFNFIEV